MERFLKTAIPLSDPLVEASLGTVFRQCALDQLTEIDANLQRGGAQRNSGVHDARAAVRRFRSILPMCGDMHAADIRKADAAMRRLGRGLSALRDAFVAAQSAKISPVQDHSTGALSLWTGVRRKLQTQLAKATKSTLTKDPKFFGRRNTVQRLQQTLHARDWSRLRRRDVLAVVRESCIRMRRAKRDVLKHPGLVLQHRLRRRVRRLLMQLQCLTTLAQRDSCGSRTVQEKMRWIRNKARKMSPSKAALKTLGDALGLQQDARLFRASIRRTKSSVAGKRAAHRSSASMQN